MAHDCSRASPCIAIVIPALNEAGVIGEVVTALRSDPTFVERGGTRIIVVDNGSDDDTAAVARAAGAEVASEPRRGYGYACQAGVRAAAGAEVVLLMDGDGSDDVKGAACVAAKVLRGEADFAVGSRTRGERESWALTPQQRLGNAVGALALRVLYGLQVTDLGPTRAIRRDALLALDMCEMGFGWSVEMLAKAARTGLHIEEVPVDYHRRAAGRSKVAGTIRGTLLASAHILRTLARYRRWAPGVRRTQPRRALLMVARHPVPGSTKTRLGQVIGYQAAARLYTAFLQDLRTRFVTAGIRDGYDLFWYCAVPNGHSLEDFATLIPSAGTYLQQPAGTFGQRLWCGFEELAHRGYGQIVVLGSDSPHVPAQWVAQAFAALDTHDAVIGPAVDGGYYLLGQRLPIFDCFSAIQMSTPSVLAETLAALSQARRTTAFVPQSFDVDESSDLDTLLAALAAAPSEYADPAPATWLTLTEPLRAAKPALSPATPGGETYAS